MNPFKNKELIRYGERDDQAAKCDNADYSSSQQNLLLEGDCDDSDGCDDKIYTLSKDKKRA